jgi:hypothetical protein
MADDRNYWPRVVVEQFRAAGDEEMAATWERHFRERGEWHDRSETGQESSDEEVRE